MTTLHARRRAAAVAIAAGSACALALVFAAAGPARSATGGEPSAAVPVSQGINPLALKGVRALGDTAAGTAERVSFILKGRQLPRLESAAQMGMRGGYLSVSRFAGTYGQTPANVRLLQEYLAKYGIKSSAYADRLDVRATGTAAQFDAALGTHQKNYAVPALAAAGGERGIPAQRVHAPSTAPKLPGQIARYVLCVFGLSSYSPFTSSATHAPQAAAAAKAKGVVSVSHTPKDFAKEARPLYQQDVSGTNRFSAVQYLTPTDFKTVDGLTLPHKWTFNAAPKVTTGTGTGRAVPDVSANADPLTGYEIYCPQFKGNPLETDWGGTSFVAPQFNGSTAILDQYVGGRVGFWNPAIYQFANQVGSPFTPIGASGTGDDNLYYTGTHGLTYNVGTGLGLPDMARLAADFATEAAAYGHLSR